MKRSQARWKRARKKSGPLRTDEDVREGKRYLKKTKEEASAFKSLRRGRSALDNEEFEDAIRELAKIDDSSLYYSDDGEGGEGAVDLLAQATDAFVEAKLLESQRLDDAGEAAAAIATINQALKLAPEDPSAIAMKAELSEELEEQPSAARKVIEKPQPVAKRSEQPKPSAAKAEPRPVAKASAETKRRWPQRPRKRRQQKRAVTSALKRQTNHGQRVKKARA